MPRLSRKYKQEWAFYLDNRNRMKLNDLCKKCRRECKRGFRAIMAEAKKWRLFQNAIEMEFLRPKRGDD